MEAVAVEPRTSPRLYVQPKTKPGFSLPYPSPFSRPRKLAVTAAVGAAVLLALLGGIDLHARWTPRQYRDTARIHRALALIPPNASVAASIHFEPHLSHRADLYTSPEPFVPIDWGGSSSPPELATRSQGVRFVVYAAGDAPIEYPHPLSRVLSLVRREAFVPIYRDGPIVVLERAK